MGRVQDKIAVVTGAASGIGLATAKLMIEEGARVVLADIATEAGQRAAKELGTRASFRHLDVTQEDQWIAAAEWRNIPAIKKKMLRKRRIKYLFDVVWRIAEANFCGICSLVRYHPSTADDATISITTAVCPAESLRTRMVSEVGSSR